VAIKAAMVNCNYTTKPGAEEATLVRGRGAGGRLIYPGDHES